MSLLDDVRRAGVIGAGGAGFPTHVKLQSKAQYILMNSAECEPLLEVDQQLMTYYPDEVIKGFLMAKTIVEAERAVIGIKAKHKKIVKILYDAIERLRLKDEVDIHLLPDIYPAGDEQVLVYEITGRIVPELGIPLAVGCVVINTETALNIYRAVQGEAVTMKYVTVAGDVPKPSTYCVPVGTPLTDLFKLSGRANLNGYSVIDGGPMMGLLLSDSTEYVTKKTKGLIVLPNNHYLIAAKKKTMMSAKLLNRSACEQCRICTDLCPRYLLGHGTSPHKMVRAMSFSIKASRDVAVAQTCCQCNLCEYFACPAGINPKMANVYYMNQLRQAGIKYSAEGVMYKTRTNREYRLIPSKRLIARINLKRYLKAAPFASDSHYAPSVVGIHTNSHIGAPAKIVVEVGALVKSGDVIAEIVEGSLGATVHASIDGIIESIKDNLVMIRRVHV